MDMYKSVCIERLRSQLYHKQNRMTLFQRQPMKQPMTTAKIVTAPLILAAGSTLCFGRSLSFDNLLSGLDANVFCFGQYAFCLSLLLIFSMKPNSVAKPRSSFSILFLLELALPLPTIVVSIVNMKLHYLCAVIFILMLLASSTKALSIKPRQTSTFRCNLSRFEC